MTVNEETSEFVLNEISKFKHNMVGTNILEPLKAAQTGFKSSLKKRIFLLTDGAVDNSEAII